MNLLTIYSLHNQGKIKPLFEIDYSILQGLTKKTFYNSEGERTRKEYRFNNKRIVVVRYQSIIDNSVLKGFEK